MLKFCPLTHTDSKLCDRRRHGVLLAGIIPQGGVSFFQLLLFHLQFSCILRLKAKQHSKGRHIRQDSCLLHNQMIHKTQIHFFRKNRLLFFFCLKITHHKRPKWMRTRALRALNSANQQPFNFFLMKNLESNELPALFISIIAAPVKLHTPRSPNYRTAGRT